jgi:phosphatidylinositol-3-phosphatase
LLSKAGKTWKSYQEDIDLVPAAGGKFNNVPLPADQFTVPISSLSGTFVSGVNAFNGSNQYNYAAKHNPQVFFTDSNGGNDSSTSNPLASHYAPLQQFFDDLNNNQVADYNWITPDQFNDMHTSLTGGYKGLTGDTANIRQGDDFLAKVVPIIMASKAYQDNGVIILWWDESESDGMTGDNPDAFDHTVPEIIISKHARKNENGIPYASLVNLTHSSDLKTMQEISR